MVRDEHGKIMRASIIKDDIGYGPGVHNVDVFIGLKHVRNAITADVADGYVVKHVDETDTGNVMALEGDKFIAVCRGDVTIIERTSK